MSAIPTPPLAGSLPERFGPYRIVKRLGQGGMGTVYLALDTRLDRQVALKVCHLGDNPEAMERFRREAKAAASLRHPNLCPVHECDVIDGIPYFTMAFIEGPTLDQWVERRGGLSQREAALLVRKLALALQAAHDKGVIHRDLKPSNIAMERTEPIVLDFGLARHTEPSDKRLTRSGAIIGTPTYMAPEQVEGNSAAIGPATDVYALGVILYELLTGRAPFEGPATAVLVAIVTKRPASPKELRADIDVRIEHICTKCLAKQPGERWASMTALSAALTECVKSLTAVVGDRPAPALRTQKTNSTVDGVRAVERPPTPTEEQAELAEKRRVRVTPPPPSAQKPRPVSDKRNRPNTEADWEYAEPSVPAGRGRVANMVRARRVNAIDKVLRGLASEWTARASKMLVLTSMLSMSLAIINFGSAIFPFVFYPEASVIVDDYYAVLEAHHAKSGTNGKIPSWLNDEMFRALPEEDKLALRAAEKEEISERIIQAFLLLIQIFWCFTIVVGAVKMKNLESYRWSMVSAIMSLNPLNFSFPGVWALYVLNKPEVRAGFACKASD